MPLAAAPGLCRTTRRSPGPTPAMMIRAGHECGHPRLGGAAGQDVVGSASWWAGVAAGGRAASAGCCEVAGGGGGD
jgi:hypothetical protein